jgi:uncharacterized membrane protein
MSWTALLVLGAGTYAAKAIGPLLLGNRELPPWAGTGLALLPAALLAALVATQTVADGRVLVLDARLAAVAAAAVAVWFRAPFIVVVAVGTLVAAGLRAVGMP